MEVKSQLNREEPAQRRDFWESVEKIEKYISQKPEKCIELLRQLISSQEDISVRHFLRVIKVIGKIEYWRYSNLIGVIYDEMIGLIAKPNIVIEPRKEIDERKTRDAQDLEDLKSIIHIPLRLSIGLMTDDSFKFHKSLKDLKQEIERLDKWAPKEKTINEIISAGNEIQYDDCISSAIHREWVFDCLILLYRQSNSSWAGNSIKQLYKEVILHSKDKFSRYQIERILDTVNSANPKENTKKITLLDSKTRDTPLESYYKYSDARAVKLVDASNKWESKQKGLTYGKLEIN